MVENGFAHIEWESTDLERTQLFLSGLFGWSFMPLGDDYLAFRPPGTVSGGILRRESVHPGSSPVVLIEVQEITPYLEKAVLLGSKVTVPKTPIPGMGWFAHVADADGNLFGLVQGPPAS